MISLSYDERANRGTDLGVVDLVLERHEQHAGDAPRERALACGDLGVDTHGALAHAVAEVEDGLEGRPVFVFFGHERVVLWVCGQNRPRGRE